MPDAGSSSSASAPSNNSTVPAAPPTAAKRKYDALVAELGGSDSIVTQTGKRAKRDTMDTKGPLDKLTSMAKYFHRGVHPFYDIGYVMHVGSQSRWAVPVSIDPSNTVVVPDAELQRQKRYNDAFDKLVAILPPDSLELLRDAYKGDSHWKMLITKLRKAASDARYQDTATLKYKTNYLPSDPTTSISPPITTSESKSDRGVNHPMLRDAIIPWPLRLKIHERQPVEDGEDASASPLTAEATAALKALLNGAKDIEGKPALTAANFPACFYAEGEYDPADPEHGLLRSPFLLRVARHIWTAPGSAMDGASKLKKICAARAHGKFVMTPEMLGYVGCQARTMISTSNWGEKDGKYDYSKLFKSIVELFENPEDAWAVETLTWYQQGVFACGDCDVSGDEDSDEEDDSEMAMIRARRAKRSSATPSG